MDLGTVQITLLRQGKHVHAIFFYEIVISNYYF